MNTIRKAWKETFISENRIVSKVDVEETYLGSQHFLVKVYFKGYGVMPQAAEFALREVGFGKEASLTEGYGIFRKEYAIGLAKLLTA